MLTSQESIDPNDQRRKIFVPISVGNRFYTRARMQAILDRLSIDSAELLILICDRLRYFAYRGRNAMDKETAAIKARKESDELRSMIEKVAHHNVIRYRIDMYSDHDGNSRFRQLKACVQSIVEDNEDVYQECLRISDYYLARFYEAPDERARKWQCTNTIGAATISLYCTECLGFNEEYYKDADGMLIQHLYAHHPDLLKAALQKATLERKFTALLGSI